MRGDRVKMTFPFKAAHSTVKPMLHGKLKSLSSIVLKPAPPNPKDIPSCENTPIVMTCTSPARTHIRHTQRRADTAGERGVSSSPRLK